MSEAKLDKSRIAKNTFYLFIRMFFSMAISLYTSRIVLEALGVENYGIFNVVGGLVGFISYLNGAMQNASSRFITYSLGADDCIQTREVFNATIGIHVLLCVLIVLLAETVGVYLFYDKLVMPAERMGAAMVAYQVSIAMTVLSILSAPFGAMIIAKEKMSIYAYIAIMDVVLKLVICYIIQGSSGDKLVLYAILLLGTSVIGFLVNVIYCSIKFPESHLIARWSKKIMRKIIGFAGWCLVGSTAGVLQGQGINLLLNVYGGPVLNAARGLALQVQAAIMGFVANFQVAVGPQLIKSYAAGEKANMFSLIFLSSKYSFFILYGISLPLMCNIDEVLGVWLVEVPPYTSLFLLLVIAINIVSVLSEPLMKSAGATGNIKKYQLVVGGTMLLVLPLAYLALKVGLPVWSVFIAQLLIAIVCTYLRVRLLRGMIGLSGKAFWHNVVLPIIRVILPTVLLSVCSVIVCPFDGLPRFIIISVWCMIINFGAIWYLGMNGQERYMWAQKGKRLINRVFKRGLVSA